MKKKYFVSLIGLLCLIAMSSCSNDDEISPQPKSKEDDIWWGYFKGTINSEEISLKNSDYSEHPVKNVRESIHDTSSGNDSINIMNTDILCNDTTALFVVLYDLNPGIRYLISSKRLGLYDSCIKMVTQRKGIDGKSQKSYYVPNENNPVKVEITDVLWLSQVEPIIDVEVDGVLYNDVNPEDSIVLNACYGVR